MIDGQHESDRELDRSNLVVPDLWQTVAQVVNSIPCGNVATLGDVARWLGDIKAARWLGDWLRRHAHDERCSCHRLVRSNGELGGYIHDTAAKIDRLESESIEVCGNVVDLARFGYRLTPPNPTVLEPLRAYQLAISERATVVESLVTNVRTVGGIDLSYKPGSQPCQAVACLSCVDADTTELLWYETLRGQICFPYITSYLAFRELPMMCELVTRVREQRELPDLLLVDGSGILHPRRAGIATMLGAETGCATIGVSKKRLIGDFETGALERNGFVAVNVDGEVLGHAMLPKTKSKRPCFSSPGYGVGIDEAGQWTEHMMTHHRDPEPIYWADRLSRDEVNNTVR